MSPDPFADPSSGDFINFNDLQGCLLLFNVLSLEEHVPTVHTVAGEKSPAIRADVDVLDGTAKGQTFANALVFPTVLRSQLSPNVGGRVLGRLAKGDAKPGKNAPWTLQVATDADRELGRQFLSATAFSTPTSGSAPPF